MDIKEEHILGDAIEDHWYYVAKGRALKSFLGHIAVDEVLDVGAGSGIFTRQLIDAGIARSGVCVDPFYAEERDDDYKGHPISFVREVDAVPQRLILMMDVLEHVDDDVALLKKYADLMPQEGLIAITVPAFQWLWSGHDVFLEHRRRYTLKQVKAVVERAGLKTIKDRYFFGGLFPAVAMLRLGDHLRFKRGHQDAKSDLRPLSEGPNKALIAFHDVERRTLFRFNRFAGLSVFCLAARA